MALQNPAKGKRDISKLLAKVQTMDLSQSTFWKVPEGRSTFRILPPTGTMEFFFVEVGQHYVGDSYYYCPVLCNEGNAKQYPCPICEVNEALYAAGEKEAAADFRVGRKWMMNIIERPATPGGEQGKPVMFVAGQSVMQTIISLVGDEDYGDITDPDIGWDIKIEKAGKGKETKYSVRPAAKSTPISVDREIATQIMAQAKDIAAYVAERLLDYTQLAKKSGVDVYLDMGDAEEDSGLALEEEDDDVELVEEELAEEDLAQAKKVTASALIKTRLAARK